jgi:predicted RNase H-like HicB family nuclease
MLPWSIRGPFEATDDHGNTHYEVRIGELPDFFVAGSSQSEVLYEFKDALLAFLESYTNEDEHPPVPRGEPARYVVPSDVRRPLPARVRVPRSDSTAGSPPATVALV